MALFSREQACRQIGVRIEDADDDVFLLIQDYTAGITSALGKHLSETIDPVVVVEEMYARPGEALRTAQRPVTSLVSVVSYDGTRTWDVTKLRVSSGGLITARRGSPFLFGDLVTTYNAGYLVYPPNYVQGGLVMLQHLWETQRGVGEMESGVVGPEEMHQRIASTTPLPRKVLEWIGNPKPIVF